MSPVENGSILIFATLNKVFVVVVILLPKILEIVFSNDDLYNLLVQIKNNCTLYSQASREVRLQRVAKWHSSFEDSVLFIIGHP